MLVSLRACARCVSPGAREREFYSLDESDFAAGSLLVFTEMLLSIGVNWSELFPTRGGLVTFALYVLLFVFQGVFITASKRDGVIKYNTTLVVFLTELLKLSVSAILYCRKNGCTPPLWKALVQNYRLLLLYFIPSMLYTIYNNLAFVNLAHYDPTTYYVLLQLRVVITAILFQCLFNKKLTHIQWVSLGLLTLGCIVKNVTVSKTGADTDAWEQIFSIYTLLINFQNVCSCLAGTYNEYLLKKNGAEVDIFLQNIFMYLDSITCSFIVIFFQDQLKNLTADLRSLNDAFIVCIIITNAAVGIVTSFFLKNLNSILKTYASAIELVITAVVCYMIFGIIITWSTVISIALVSIAVILYAKNPVNNSTALVPTNNINVSYDQLEKV